MNGEHSCVSYRSCMRILWNDRASIHPLCSLCVNAFVFYFHSRHFRYFLNWIFSFFFVNFHFHPVYAVWYGLRRSACDDDGLKVNRAERSWRAFCTEPRSYTISTCIQQLTRWQKKKQKDRQNQQQQQKIVHKNWIKTEKNLGSARATIIAISSSSTESVLPMNAPPHVAHNCTHNETNSFGRAKYKNTERSDDMPAKRMCQA